ncbi:MAG TPA: homoserine kinase [Planococcus sp. (in: firmicutes)]|nr:homoserine kinase [Planococcus sp. (in: firmicutes)]
MRWKEFSVRVPASTANLGPGFDSIGLALDLHMTVHVSTGPEWKVEYADQAYKQLTGGAENLIVATALAVANQAGRELPRAELYVETDIPLGRGLGSSASAIAAGIEIADCLLGLNLTMDEKLRIGSDMEGHPDNISASLLGGLTISYFDEETLEVVHIPDVPISVIILVPPNELLTVESRGLLPQSFSHGYAVRGSAASNVLSAALAKGDWATAGRMMGKDQFHEPFRRSQFPGFEEIQTACQQAGAFGSAISGAGPSMFIAVPQDAEQVLAELLTNRFPHYECLVTKPSSTGIKSCEKVV